MTQSFKKEFSVRYDMHRDELRWLFMELYDDEEAYSSLVDMMYNAWESRSAALKKLDRTRVADPAWYKGHDLVGMMLYVNAFAGDLKGVKKKIPYLQDSGVNYLHLMPLLESPEGRSDGGYAVSDFRKVQPELGTMKDLSSLTSQCHKNGISVCLDFVMNHTSEDHEWAMKAKAGEKEYQDRYFFFDNWDIPNEYEKTVPQVFPTTAPGNFTCVRKPAKLS